MVLTQSSAGRLASPLRSRPYRLLLIGQTVSGFGDAITPIALAFAVLQLGGSATQLGLVVAAYAGAKVATVLAGGLIGDRLPRGLVMRGSAAASALSQAVIAISLIGGWSGVALLGMIGLVNGCVSALGGPSGQAMTRETVPAANLAAAISLRRLASNAAMIAGYGAAGVLVAAWGPGWSIAVDAVTFAVAAICFALIRLPARTPAARPVPADHPLPADRPSLLADLRGGAVEVLRHPWLWALIAQALVYHLFYGGAQGVLGPIVVKAEYSEAAWGWALAVLMLGFVAGGLVTLRFRPSRGLFTGTLFLGLTACFPAALAVKAGLAVVLAGAFLHGLGLEIFSVNWDLSIQQNVAADKLARVYSIDQVGSFLARPIGLVLTGPVGEAVGYSRWLGIVAAVMLGSVLLALLVPGVRRLRRIPPAQLIPR